MPARDVKVPFVGERNLVSVQCAGCLTFWQWPQGTEPDEVGLCPICAVVPIPNFSGSAVDWDGGGAMVGSQCHACGKVWSLRREDLPPGVYIMACCSCKPELPQNLLLAGLGIEPGKKDGHRMAAKKKESNGSDRKEIDRYEEMLPCKIPDDDIAGKAETLAQVIDERAQTKDRRRAVMAQFREKLTHYDERIKELGESVRLKTERRPVQCAEFLIDRQNKVEILRLDTGDVIKTRAATPEDRQEDMFPSEGKRGAKPQKAEGDDPLTDAT